MSKNFKTFIQKFLLSTKKLKQLFSATTCAGSQCINDCNNILQSENCILLYEYKELHLQNWFLSNAYDTSTRLQSWNNK
jgi:hypothetical protein